VGLSIRTLFTDLLSQMIIFLFLLDNQASYLIIVPSFIAIGIQMWKIRRATGLKITFGKQNKYLVGMTFIRVDEEKLQSHATADIAIVKASESETIEKKTVNEDKATENSLGEEKEETVMTEKPTSVMSSSEKDSLEKLEKQLIDVSLEADAFAMKYLSMTLFPLIVILVVYSLLYVKYRSWYSWLISSSTSCVYAFGFILMCPQLYINHRMKSVSYLPWQVCESKTNLLFLLNGSCLSFFLSFRSI
jgi:hypothetical protein